MLWSAGIYKMSLYIAVQHPDLAFERNTFEYNESPLIIDYVPILREDTFIDFSPANVLNANEGGVFELIDCK